MSDDKKFKNESQDARRHDEQHAVHPNEKLNKKNKEQPHEKHDKKK